MSENDVQNSSSQTLAAPIWFAYPQTGGTINLHRKKLSGTIEVSEGQLSIVANDGRRILSNKIDDISSVKIWAPVMTFHFNDNTKFQIDFNETVYRGGPSNESLRNFKPFEDYFSYRDLIHKR